VDREDRGNVAERRRVGAEAGEQQVQRGMPVMKMYRVRFLWRPGDPGRGCRAEQREFRRVRGKRASGLVAKIDAPLPMSRKQRVVEDEIDDAEWLNGLFVVTEKELPAPRPKTKPKKKG